MIASYDDYINDLHDLVNYIKIYHPTQPIYLIGQSMGGAIAILYSIKYSDVVKGIILIGPMCGITQDLEKSWITVNVILTLSYIVPSLRLINISNCTSTYIDKYLEARKNSLYNNNSRLRLDTSRECYYMMDTINKNVHNFNVPVFAIHSKNDKITLYNTTEDFITRCSSSDKKLELLEEGNHNVLIPTSNDDIQPSIILIAICRWIEERMNII